MVIRGDDGLCRMLIDVDGQPSVFIVDVAAVPGEVEIDVAVGPDDLALEDLVSRCRGGGVSEHAVTSVPPTTGTKENKR